MTKTVAGFFAHELEGLTGRRYVAAVMVYTRPPWGFGWLLPWLGLCSWSCPSLRVPALLLPRVLCRTDADEIEEWVFNYVYSGGGHMAPAEGDLLGHVDPMSLEVQGGGLWTARVRWGHDRGFLNRAFVADFRALRT